MPRITIEQMNADGSVFRTFEQYPTQAELAERLHRITYAYNLERTRVSVDGEVVRLRRHLHIPSAYSRCEVCGEIGFYNASVTPA